MKNHRLSHLTALILIAAMLCALAACGAPGGEVLEQEASSSAASASVIATTIIRQAPIENMTALKAESIPLHYDFDLSLVDDYAVYMSTLNTSADEIAIFHLKDPNRSQEIISALNSHIQTKMKGFQALSPNEYEKLSHARLLASGDLIALLVCSKIDTAYSILVENYQFPAMTNAAAKKGAILARKGD